MPTHRFAKPLLIALLLLIAPSAASAEDLIGMFLSWQQDPTTTMTVTWVDIYADSSSTILYRKYDGQKHSADTKWQTATAKQSTMGPTTLQLRRVELTGLEPDTRYEFGIGDTTKDVTQFWRFDTMPAKLTRPLTFVAGGDMMHNRAMVDDMNEEMQKLEPDFALLGGDIAYENGVHGTHWIDWLQSWTNHAVTKDKRLIPLVITIGNHEVKGGYNGTPPQDAPYFYSIFPLPQNRSYYALDFGKYLSLIILDSQHTNPIAGPQADWLAEAMSKRGDQQFLFACYHFPPTVRRRNLKAARRSTPRRPSPSKKTGAPASNATAPPPSSRTTTTTTNARTASAIANATTPTASSTSATAPGASNLAKSPKTPGGSPKPKAATIFGTSNSIPTAKSNSRPSTPKAKLSTNWRSRNLARSPSRNIQIPSSGLRPGVGCHAGTRSLACCHPPAEPRANVSLPLRWREQPSPSAPKLPERSAVARAMHKGGVTEVYEKTSPHPPGFRR